MIKIKCLILLLILYLVNCNQITCLLEEPLTNQCIKSLQLSTIQSQMLPYLCIIASERQIWQKSQTFCRQATLIDPESGYRYFKALLLNKKFNLALTTQYQLFFANPFNHNKQLLTILNQTSIELSQLQEKDEFMSSLNDFEKSIYFFYLNKTQNSESHLKQYIVRQNKSQFIYEHFLMCRILQKQYKYYDGLAYINDVLVKNVKFHPYFYHLKANFLMHHVQFEKAIIEYEKSNIEFDKIYSSKGFSFSNYNIGLCYEKLGKIQEALKYYQKSIINLNSAQALNALGHAYYSHYEQKNDPKHLNNAQSYYLKALQLNNNYNLAIFNLGMVYLAKKDSKKAIQYFQRCLAMQNAFRSCKYGLIKSFYQLNDTSKIEPIISSIQRNQQTMAQLAAILYEVGDSKRALKLIGDKDDYKSLDLMQWKGFNEYAIGDYQSASKSFSRAIFLGSKKGYIYYSLGLAQLQQKLFQQCYNSFDTAYKLDKRKQTKDKRQQCKKNMPTLQL